MRSRSREALARTTAVILTAAILVVAGLGIYFLFFRGAQEVQPPPTTGKNETSTTPPPTSAEKKLLVIAYSGAQETPEDEAVPYSSISPSWYSNITLDALILAGRMTSNTTLRKAIYNAVQKVTSYELPLIWVVQGIAPRAYWGWITGIYFHPTLEFRFNHLDKDPGAPNPGVINFGGTEEPHSLDPAVSYWGFDWWIMHQIYDKLVTYEGENSEYVIPALGAAWAFTEDSTEWYFVIRGGVLFYDPWENKTYQLEPEDVVYSLQRVVTMRQDPYWLIDAFIDVNASSVVGMEEFKSELGKGLYTTFKGATRKVSSYDELLATFNYSGPVAGVVKLKLRMAYPAILNVLATSPASIVCRRVVEAHGGVEPGETNTWVYEHPVGTGPYYLVKWEHRQFLELAANPYYWGGDKPKIKSVKIYLIPEDSSRIMLFNKGDLDVIDIPASLFFRVKGVTLDYGGKTWEVVSREQPTFWLYYIVLNVREKPFDQVEVRRALAYATPYDQIASVALGGLAFKAYGVIPEGMFGYQDADVMNYTYDINRARELLEKAGINPSDYRFTIIVPEGYKEFQDEATLLQAAWSQLGFKVDIQVLSRPVFNDRIMSRDGFDVNLIAWGPDYVDPDDYAGPLTYGGHTFDSIEVKQVYSLDEAAQLVDTGTAKTIECLDWIIIVGERR